MKTLLSSALVLAVTLGIAAQAHAAPSSTATKPSSTKASSTAQKKPASKESSAFDYTDKVAELNTDLGTITVRFFPDVAPNHVKNFLDLSKSGFYNGTKFHRIIPGFMIQGGDPNTKKDNRSIWGTGGSGKNVNAEFNSVHHARGIVSMARAKDPNSASSQFFIVVADSGFLDNQYTVFGQVVSGMDIADKIVNGKRNGDQAAEPVSIKSVTIRAAKDGEKGPAPK